MMRLALAVGAGFLAITVLTLALEVALLRFLFKTPMGLDAGAMPPAYLLAYGAGSLVFAIVGGCITAAIAKRYEAPTILGALMLGIGIGGLVMNRGNEPIWFAATVPFVGAVGATIAGYRWLHHVPGAETPVRRPARKG